MEQQEILYTRIKPSRVYEAVVEQIQDLIMAEQFQPGDQLLPERELARHLGVSRTAVRDAIKVLSEKGLVEVRPGAGTFVVQKISDMLTGSMGLLLQIEGSSYDALQEVRGILEVEIAGLAAERATELDMAKMEQALEEMQSQIAQLVHDAEASTRYIEADLDFHLAIVEATHNKIFAVLLTAIVDLSQETRRMLMIVPGAPVRTLEHHKQVLKGIQHKSREEARRAMQEHMEQVATDLEIALSLTK